MPSSSTRKRHRSPAPGNKAGPKHAPPPAKRRKQETVFDLVEANTRLGRSVEENKAFLSRQETGASETEEEEDDGASSDDQDEMDFEDAMDQPAAKRRKVQPGAHLANDEESSGSEDESEDEMQWEDAAQDTSANKHEEPAVSGDLELTLDSLPSTSLGASYGAKKGPSKIERQIRVNAHCIHVQCLLYHNLVRNGWACDKEIQKHLTSIKPKPIEKELERWRRACEDDPSHAPNGTPKNDDGEVHKSLSKKARSNDKKYKNQREWGGKAEGVKRDMPDLSHGDPTVRLLKALSAWWRKNFNITAPGLRKQGWKGAVRLENEVKSFRQDPHDPEEHGERFQSRKEFRKLAKQLQGSRDVGAQLFVALLRGLGLQTRLVCSLQPLGFGFSKSEDALPPKAKKKQPNGTAKSVAKAKSVDSDIEMLSDSPQKKREKAEDKERYQPKSPQKNRGKAEDKKKSRPSGKREAPIDLSDGSGLSDAPDSDDESLIDITPPMPTTSVQKYDRDLTFPHYWAEVLSPTTQTWIPVDPIVLNLVATDEDAMALFEPRGTKADKAKQVHAYVVAFNADGTAKDVTVRYLKRHMFPGKTKGVRMPAEKQPILNRRGKTRGYREYDFFRSVMAIYERPLKLCSAADIIEDHRELKPIKPERKAKEGGEDTLQGLKSSAEFVLERHLRREEAIKPGSKHVRLFTFGKGDKATEEPVFLRKDILIGKTVETWHKEGREVKEGEQPIKFVPFRAVTTIRKRELEEAERASGEKMKQGLYAKTQTQYIVPPPIGPDRAIPKNAYGNMDVYVPSMVPKGAVHIPLKGTAKICRKLGLDYAEACTGFEFGHRMAVPVLTGVVVAEENEDVVIDAWEVEEAQKREKEKAKREKLALGMWKKFYSGLAIVARLKRQYGDEAGDHFDEVVSGLSAKKGRKKKDEAAASGEGKKKETMKKDTKKEDTKKKQKKEEDIEVDKDDEGHDTISHYFNHTDEDGGGGGFIPAGMDVEEPIQSRNKMSSMVVDDDDDGGGGFLVDDEDDKTSTHIKPEDDPEDLSTPPVSDVEAPNVPSPRKQMKSKKQTQTKASKKQNANGKTPRGQAKAADPAPTRRASGRGAARKSREAVKSHYFEGEGDDGSGSEGSEGIDDV